MIRYLKIITGYFLTQKYMKFLQMNFLCLCTEMVNSVRYSEHTGLKDFR